MNYRQKHFEFALMLEEYIIQSKDCEKIPQYVKEQLCDDGPEGIAYHPDYGWFILCCGQGPFVGWCEGSLEEMISHWWRRKDID